MYLTDILMENVGPISKLDITLPFKDDGCPKPVMFVGANGSGKSILLAHIADALVLMAAPHFQDVVPHKGLGHAYFKIAGPTNQRVGTSFGLALLGFKQGDKRATYVEKTGSLAPSARATAIQHRFPGATWPNDNTHKAFSGFDAEDVRAICSASALCFFPSTRREIPHWINVEAIDERGDREPELADARRYQQRLQKPISLSDAASKTNDGF